MDSLDNYKACLQYFAERAAKAVTRAHQAKWSATREAWRDGESASGEPEPVCPRAPSCVCEVKDTAELVVVRYESLSHIDLLVDAEFDSDPA